MHFVFSFSITYHFYHAVSDRHKLPLNSFSPDWKYKYRHPKIRNNHHQNQIDYEQISIIIYVHQYIFDQCIKFVPIIEHTLHAGIIVISSSGCLSIGGSISKIYIKCSVGTCWPMKEAARGSFQEIVTSFLFRLLLDWNDVIFESLTCLEIIFHIMNCSSHVNG